MPVKTLLIVDDSLMSRQILRNRFRKLRGDWQIIDCDNGLDAIEVARQVQPDFVTMDLNMPQLPGLDAASSIRALLPQARIALVTANAQDAVKQRAAEMGWACITKPVDSSGLLAVVSFFES